MHMQWIQNHSVMSNSLLPHGLYSPWNSELNSLDTGQNTGVGRVGIPFSRGSSRPKNRIGVFCIAGRFFTSWATKIKLIKVCLCYGITKHSIGVFRPWCYNTCGVLLRKRDNKHEKKKSKGYKDRQWYCCFCLVSCNPMDCSLPGSSVCVISQTRIRSGLSFPSTGNPPNPCFLYYLHWRCRFFPISHQRSPRVREY